MPTRRAERRVREWLTHLIPVPLVDVPESDRVCTLCHEPFPALVEGGDYPVRVRPIHPNSTCQHVFGRLCIEQHLSSGRGYSRRCPICREHWFGGAEGDEPEGASGGVEGSAIATAHRQRGRFRTPGETPEDRRLELLFGLEGANERDRQQFFAALDRTLLHTVAAEANVQATSHPPRALANTDDRLSGVHARESDRAGSLEADEQQGNRRGSAEEEDEEMERRMLQAELRQDRPTARDERPHPTTGDIAANFEASPPSARQSSDGESPPTVANPVSRRQPIQPGYEQDATLSSAGRITRTIGFLEQIRGSEEVSIDGSYIAEGVNDVERAVGVLWRSVEDERRRRGRVRFIRRN
jgi:hypothetical protein